MSFWDARIAERVQVFTQAYQTASREVNSVRHDLPTIAKVEADWFDWNQIHAADTVNDLRSYVYTTVLLKLFNYPPDTHVKDWRMLKTLLRRAVDQAIEEVVDAQIS